METYSERLQKELDQIDKDYPIISEIIIEIKKIDKISMMEFDYEVERISWKYRKILELLEKYNLITPKIKE
jgi:hypothetical protein